MAFLDQFPPEQRKLLMYGIPVVGVFALISIAKGKGSGGTTTAAAQTQAAQSQAAAQAAASAALNAAAQNPTGWTMASTDALSTDQLAQYETSVSQGLEGVQQQLAQITNAPSATNPQLTNQQKVDNAYQDLLGRTADSGGETYWTGIANSQGIGAVYSGIEGSTEYKQSHPTAA